MVCQRPLPTDDKESAGRLARKREARANGPNGSPADPPAVADARTLSDAELSSDGDDVVAEERRREDPEERRGERR